MIKKASAVNDPVAGFNVELTDEQLAEWKRRFLAAWNDPEERRRCNRRDLRRNLSRRARARLAVRQMNISAGIWLMDHVSIQVAERFWRITERLRRARN